MTDITSNSLSIIGIGIGEQLHLQIMPEAQKSLKQADVVIGSMRQLELAKRSFVDLNAEFIELPKFKDLKNLIESLLAHKKKIAILASGDPLYFGIGRWFNNNFSAFEPQFFPGVSSIQAACHALGLSQQDCKVISLHGRALATLKRHLKPFETLVILTDKYSQPQHLAQTLSDCGFDGKIHVCEQLGFDAEKISSFSSNELIANDQGFNDLHVTVIELDAGKNSYLPFVAGIEDTSFITGFDEQGNAQLTGKGLITKKEVRLNILNLMQPVKNDVIWDIGAGCGGVAVELANACENAEVIAIEHHPQRLSCLQANSERFGVVNNLSIVEGRAPECFVDVANHKNKPNKIFIGGSDGELDSMFAQLIELIPQGGVIAASAVTEHSKMKFLQLADTYSKTLVCTTSQLMVSQGDTLAGQLIYRANLSVNLYQFIKA
jgi:precorrin-6B C5,15-methyltransferase / cobalt-precorrin-6B C5,C15-methyltransferase